MSICALRLARLEARVDSTRDAFARAVAFACSPFHREAWYPLQAVASVAADRSTAATISNDRADRIQLAACPASDSVSLTRWGSPWHRMEPGRHGRARPTPGR